MTQSLTKRPDVVRFPGWVFGGGPSIATSSDHHQNGWPKIFRRDQYRCVYCDRVLSADLDSLIGSATDHIVPQSLFRDEREANHPDNLAASCAVCNNLKGHYRPDEGDPAWGSRTTLLERARIHVAAEREKKRKTYAKHLGPLV